MQQKQGEKQNQPQRVQSVEMSGYSEGIRSGQCKYSCETASETLEWINAIIHFIEPYRFLIDAHVVNFFKDSLWESIDIEWMDCLRHEALQNLLLIPSGVSQDHWPASLQEFVSTLRSLVFPREQVDLQKVFPGLKVMTLNSVLSQGMNLKKKHEIEVLSAIVSSIANNVGAQKIVDVGAGQGYLAQVLSFQYHHSVVAIDACSHHGRVTAARSERIKKYYAAQMQKFFSGNAIPTVPQTVTCNVLSIGMLKDLSIVSLPGADTKQLELADSKSSLVLAGLHACGDLSVTMLKTFIECEDVKAVISIGCCYNLLSEGCSDTSSSQSGFPMSSGVKSLVISLGKRARDLACQSAERWRSLEQDAGLHNFRLHAFRAAFQMVLCRYHPEVITSSPSIGRQGKALRRQRQKSRLQSHCEERIQQLPKKIPSPREIFDTSNPGESEADVVTEDKSGFLLCRNDSSPGLCSNWSAGCDGTAYVESISLFNKFCQSGFSRLGIKPMMEEEISEIWKETQPFAEFIGPYWSLRAALGPVLETLLLLDRLLFLQEQGNLVEVVMLPIFDPASSPRNVAIIAKRDH